MISAFSTSNEAAQGAAPRGRVTLEQAAELSGLSRATAGSRTARSRRAPSRTARCPIARRDVKRLKPRDPGKVDAAGRKPIQLRPTIDRYAAWERAAGDRPVSAWLGELADAAAGWLPSE